MSFFQVILCNLFIFLHKCFALLNLLIMLNSCKNLNNTLIYKNNYWKGEITIENKF